MCGNLFSYTFSMKTKVSEVVGVTEHSKFKNYCRPNTVLCWYRLWLRPIKLFILTIHDHLTMQNNTEWPKSQL